MPTCRMGMTADTLKSCFEGSEYLLKGKGWLSALRGGPSDLPAFGEIRGVTWAEAPFPGLTKVSEASEGANAAWRRC